jgi:hypothetical protein
MIIDQLWNFQTIYGGYRNRVEIGLSYRPVRLHRLHGGIDSLETLLGFLKV